MPVMAMVVMAAMVISIMSTLMYRLFKNDSGSKSSAKSTTVVPVVVMMRVMVMKVRMVVVVVLVACHNGTCNHSSRNGSGHVGLLMMLRRSLLNGNHP